MNTISTAEDYCTATVRVGRHVLDIYYGYEVTDDDDNWMFQIKSGGTVIYEECPARRGRDAFEIWAECLLRFMAAHMVVLE